MVVTAKKGRPAGGGKKNAPASAARVEQRRKPAAKKGRAASVPKEGKGEQRKGGRGGGLH